jgi:hypothetical protein
MKDIGCSGKGCTEILKVASPDDEYIDIALEKPEGKSIEHEYQCAKQHTTKVYWHPIVVPSAETEDPRKPFLWVT